ncbi:MAG: hypothetical protein ACK5V3_01220 [Bdellovibrionales bacterium]
MKTPKRIRPSIKKDKVNPTDYLRLRLPWSCDDCTHFNPEQESCTLGYHTKHHRRVQQIKDYELSGSYALCRFQEID